MTAECETLIAQSPATDPAALANAQCARRSWKSLVDEGFFAVADQTMVSGTYFLTTVILGRAANQEQLGIYSLGFTIYMLLVGVQQALVCAPYITFGARLKGIAHDEYASRVLMHQHIGSALAALGLTLVAALFSLGSGSTDSALATLALAAVMPALLFREFCRRFGFAKMNFRAVFVLDAFIALLQFAGLAVLAWYSRLTAATTFFVFGAACLVPCLPWFYSMGVRVTSHLGEAAMVFRSNWPFSRWLLAGKVTGVAHTYVIHWILAISFDPASTGVYAACLSIVLLSNPFVLALGNVLVPKSSHAVADGQTAGVRRLITRTMLLVSLLMGVFSLALVAFGEQLLVLLYGRGFDGHGATIAVIALANLVNTIGLVCDAGLRALERSDVIFTAVLLGVAVTIAVTLVLLPAWNVFGAACGYLAGNLVAMGIRCGGFFIMDARPTPSSEAMLAG